MSVKWTGSECGILRKSKSECNEKKEELFVFGYSCKLFRDDDKALHVDQGKHLIPWMGDETLKIDRYDARGALHDLSNLEAPPGGFDWRVELTRTEQDVEQLCDEERYRALHTNEDEEEMYKEEELKRLHAAGYGQVGFNYDAPSEPSKEVEPVEVEEPFLPTLEFKALLSPDILLPETLKQNAIIEKTAKFIANQGTQMEILIKAKQGDNPQFEFLNRDSPLNPYYLALVDLVKTGQWPEKVEVAEEKPPETNDEYLHPSLATNVIESAPSIPSIHYKPSADCDYTMLISKMRCDSAEQSDYTASLAAGEVAPPGTEPALPVRPMPEFSIPILTPPPPLLFSLRPPPRFEPISTGLVKTEPSIPPNKSTGLSLMKNYNTDSGTDDSESDDCSSTDSKEKVIVLQPPEDIRLVIDKMAGYVARNGDDFAEIVRAKKDPRFMFLEPDNMYYGYYRHTMNEKRGIVNGSCDKKGCASGVVSFSIKKPKAPDPILPKPALPYESSTDEEGENKGQKLEEQKSEVPKSNIPPLCPMHILPPVVVYKLDAATENNLPVIKTIEQTPIPMNMVKLPITVNVVKEPIVLKVEEPPLFVEEKPPKVEEEVKKDTPKPVEENPREKEREASKTRTGERESPYRDRRKHKDRKKRYKRSKSEGRESRRSEKMLDKEKKRDRHREKEREERDRYKRSKKNYVFDTEIIAVEDNSDDLIDLTGDHSDSKVDMDSEVEKVKQMERRRRAAEFLKKVGVDPVAATLPNTSLASAMVDTLETLRKKNAEEEEKRKRREKRRRREQREYEESDRHKKNKRSKKYRSSDEEESDSDSPKKKKRKKEKKQSSKNKKKKREEVELEEDIAELNIDLANTLKELRTTSPTKELGLHIDEDSQHSVVHRPSTDESEGEVGDKRKIKLDREYSEGEWSSDSEVSSVVDILDSLRKGKRRRREKRRRRDRREYEDSDRHKKKKRSKKYRSCGEVETDYDSPKKKKRKKEKKQRSKNKKKRREEVELEEDIAELKIDLANTLKELRTTSPTKELGLHIDEDSQHSVVHRPSTDESEGEVGDKRKIKLDREYSEGEWSSVSEVSYVVSYD